MAGSVETGYFVVSSSDTLTIGATNYIPQISTDVEEYEKSSRPIFSMMAKMGMQEDARNWFYQWQEIQLDEPSVNCETAIPAGAAGSFVDVNLDSLVVANGDTFLDALTNQEFAVNNVYCYNGANDGSGHTAPVGGTACQVYKLPATSPIAATAANGFWMRMANLMPEGGGYRDPVTAVPVRKSNSLAYWNTSAQATILNDYMFTYYGSPFQMDVEKAQMQLTHDLERSVIFGKAFEQQATINRANAFNTSSGTIRGTQGIWDTIQTKRLQYSGAVQEVGMDSFASILFGDPWGGGDSKFIFSGPQPTADISQFVKVRWRATNTVGEQTYGLTVKEYIAPTAAGSMLFIEERQFFDPLPSRPHPYRQTMVAIEPIQFRLMRSGPSLIRIRNTSMPNSDSRSISMIATLGVKLKKERSHGIYSVLLN